jgi:PAS domain S-box-containing protein
MSNPLEILREVKESLGKPGLIKLVLALGVTIIVVVLNLFFLPGSIAAVNLAAFFFVVIIGMTNYERLARLSLGDRVKKIELETVMENVRDGVVVYDSNFRVLSLNRAAEEVLGLKAGEVLGERIEPGLIKNPRLSALTEIMFPSLAPAMTVVSDVGWPQIIDISLDNPKRELRTVLNRIINEKSEVVGFMKLITDLTREKNILGSKSEFISVAAHQLRTPLTALNWSFENLNKILAEKNPDTRGAADLAKEGWRLTELSLKIVNDLLNAAKIEDGRFGFRFEKSDLTEFVAMVVEQAKPIAEPYGVRIKFNGGSAQLPVMIDKELLAMALANIIDNGIKYNTKNGEVDIGVGPDPKNGFARVEIKDTGVGIPSADLPKMFQKFYRAQNITQLEPNGSGLGLYITKNIIDGHGGKVNIESVEGRGTTFNISLPITQATRQEAEKQGK